MIDETNPHNDGAFDEEQMDFGFESAVDDIPDPISEKAKVVSDRQKSLEDAEREAIDEGMAIEDLRERARFMLRNHILQFPKEIMLKSGSTIPKSDEINRTAFLDAIFDNGNPDYKHPVFDSFSQAIIMHDGREFDDAWLYPIIDAMGACGLDGQSYETVGKSYRSWAVRNERNLLQDRIVSTTPVWDGVERTGDYLIKLFRCHDTETTRIVSKQFWLSLYNRAMHPGCIAPISISLIGGQNVGKSYFSQLISKSMIGSDNPPTVTLTFKAAEQEKFLRNITGAAVVANVSEFYGFSSGDMNLIKSFTTLTTDSFGHKYMKERGVPRQWIVIMDGNDYKGFHRDDTGNRRFYPIFCNQLEDDAKGHPQWVKVNATPTDFEQGLGFDGEFWQIMAECRDWMAVNGMAGYVEFTNSVSYKVAEFNGLEMQKGSGTIQNEHTDTWLGRVLRAANWQKKRAMSNKEWFRVGVAIDHMQQVVKQMSGSEFNTKDLKRRMESLGFERVRDNGSYSFIIKPPSFVRGMTEKDVNHPKVDAEFVNLIRWWVINDFPNGAELERIPKMDKDEIAREVEVARTDVRLFKEIAESGF